MSYPTHADIAARLRGLADIADQIVKGSAKADPRRAKAAGLRADMLAMARDLDPYPDGNVISFAASGGPKPLVRLARDNPDFDGAA